MIFKDLKFNDDVIESRTVVRIKTTVWGDSGGVHLKKSMTLLKRKSQFPWIFDDVGQVGAEAFVDSIVNFSQVEDGIYKVYVSHFDADGFREYKLVKFVE